MGEVQHLDPVISLSDTWGGEKLCESVIDLGRNEATSIAKMELGNWERTIFSVSALAFWRYFCC
jgi:hypothetical protein